MRCVEAKDGEKKEKDGEKKGEREGEGRESRERF